MGDAPALAGVVAVSVAVPGPVAQAVAPEAASVGQTTRTARTVTLISADAALTVGSTTKRDTLSDFSSQGP